MWKRRAIGVLSSLFPGPFTRIAYDRLTNPQQSRLRENEQQVLNQARQDDLIFGGFRIRTYHWPGAGDAVLLIHGWEGQAGNFSDLVGSLRQQGFDVYAFDAPAHGHSSRGRTSPFEFAELVAVLLRQTGARKAVSHSFGGVAITYALHQHRDLALERLALLTTPDRFSQRIEDVARQVGVSARVHARLLQRLRNENIDVERFNVSDFVQNIQVDSALILHDRNDRVVPVSQSLNVHRHWPESVFEQIEGTGHFRILRTPAVLERLADFLR